MSTLTTTSYAILGLLTFQDEMSAYELTRQMARSLHFVWPRAESKVYEEPKKLVEHGLATVATRARGRQRRTVYAITPQGREALARWLAAPLQPPLLEFEGMLRVYFATAGSVETLRVLLTAIREQAEAQQRFGAALAQEYATGGGPYRDRLHLSYLGFQFLWGYFGYLVAWARWAESEVATWQDTAPSAAKSARALDVFARADEAQAESVDPERA